ncbi:hypothetical protein KA405_02310 [Patescibacteria group bacterium]|nr:hypothetical protein [Patescibacteria group bacterium]
MDIKSMSEFNSVVASNGNMPLREYSKNVSLSNSEALNNILPGVTPQDKTEIMDHLSKLSEPEKALFQERMKDSASFAQTRNDIALVLNDYKRTGAMAALSNASLISA